MTTLLGHVTAVHQLRTAALDVLRDWLPAALVDVARQTGVDPQTVPFPRSWRRVASWDSVPEDQQPVVFATSPGLVGTTQRRAEGGAWQATWRIPILAAVRGKDYEQTAERVSVYAAAIRTVLIQQPLPVAGAKALQWVGETYDVLPTQHQRTWAGALVEFDAEISTVATTAPRRQEPPEDPFADPEPFLTVAEPTSEVR